MIPNNLTYEQYREMAWNHTCRLTNHVVALHTPCYGGEDAVILSGNDEHGNHRLDTPEDRVIFHYPSFQGSWPYWLCDRAAAILSRTSYEIYWEAAESLWYLDIEDAGAAMLLKLTFGGAR